MLWAAFIISVLALVVALMALPTVFQMVFGKPRLKIHSKEYHNRGLYCLIQNLQTSNKFLKSIGVKRDAVEELNVEIGIMDKNAYLSDNLVANVNYWDKRKHEIEYDGSIRYSIRLPASSTLFARISIVGVRNGKVYICEEKPKLTQELKDGLYTMIMVITADGEWAETNRDFKVSQSEPFIEWICNG